MPNLLRFVLDLATDADARDRVRADPDAAVSTIDDTGGELTGEDVDAVLAAVRRHLGGDVERRLHGGVPSGTGPGETTADAVRRHLLAACDGVDRADEEPAPDVADAAEVEERAEVEPVDDEPAGTGDDEPDRLASTAAASSGAEATSTATGGGAPLTTGPPGPRPHLWAVGPEAGATTDAAADTWVDPSHPSAGGAALSAVPEPAEGFAFDPLELVVLTDGWPPADIEAGAEATVIAVHDDPDVGRRYEVEVADEFGGRRFLGLVPEDAIDRPR